MVLKSDAIKAFLNAKGQPDLAALYHKGMEVQVNVLQGDGQRIDAGQFGSKAVIAFTDNVETWTAFRIPRKAMSEPEDNDGPQKWDFDKHVEGIGMTGWDWQKKRSIWFAYDFDAMTGHSERHTKKLKDTELQDIHDTVMKLPFVTLRRSTSGKGLHLYVFVEPTIEVANHTEHAAMARAVLSYMSGLTGFNFIDKVDICGSNMWVWHRKNYNRQPDGTLVQNDGLKLIKQGDILPASRVPCDWKDHAAVISRRTNRVVPRMNGVTSDQFEELSGQRAKVRLDEGHVALINWLNDRNCPGHWQADQHMLIAHTFNLAQAHKALGLRGEFHTLSTGKDEGFDINCFSGDTEIITRKGVVTLREAAEVGQADLLVWNGKDWVWQNAPVKSFGVQKTLPLQFGNGSVVRTTNNHQWLWMHKGQIRPDRKFTYELTEDKTELPIAQRKLPVPDREAIAHGFVYGDGNRYRVTKTKDHYATNVVFFGEKDAIFNLVSEFGSISFVNHEEYGRLNTVRNLPENWKDLPENPTPEYAFGFILGLLTADGFVHGPYCSIQQSDEREVVETIRKLAVHAGLYARPVRAGTPGSFANAKQPWLFSFSTYNMTEGHLIRKDQKQRFRVNKRSRCTTPSFIGQVDREEEVFCAVVPQNHNFTLANGVTSGNCFAFPIKGGAWAIRRYGTGTGEHKYWVQDGRGWTRCYLNRDLSLSDVARLFDAIEIESGGYQFEKARIGTEALKRLGIDVQLPDWINPRVMKVKEHRQDYKIVCMIPTVQGDIGTEMQGWANERGHYRRIFNNPRAGIADEQVALADYDDMVRHIISENGEDLGWVVSTEDGTWRHEPVNHVKLLMTARSIGKKDIEIILGQAISNAWVVVNQPFQPEYPGDRQWNRSSARFKIAPTLDGEALSFPTWLRITDHCGRSLDTAIADHSWCKANGITTGGQYLRLWFASLIRHPQAPLPYLAFYGPQDSGKSTIHEAFCQLILDGGYMDGAMALVSQGNFNGELQDSILCTLEEVDLRNKVVAQRMKDWVTSAQISVHIKGQTPYKAPNYTHWIQCVNDRDFIPVFQGDTRVVVSYVDSIPDEEKIPKRELWTTLAKEAPDFLAHLLALDIPDSRDRLMLPVVKTSDKVAAEYASLTPVEQFFKDFTFRVPGAYTSIDEMHKAFENEVGIAEAANWGKIKFKKAAPQDIPCGRISGINSQLQYFGNVSLRKDATPGARWINSGTFMRREGKEA